MNMDEGLLALALSAAKDQIAVLEDVLAQRDAEIARRIQGVNLLIEDLERRDTTIDQLRVRLSALESQQAASVGGEREAFEAEFPRIQYAPAVYWSDERQRYVGHGDAFENNGPAYQKKYESWLKASAALSPAGGGVVMPERKQIPDQMTFPGGPAYYAKQFDIAIAWNACLDEVARLNAKPSEEA